MNEKALQTIQDLQAQGFNFKQIQDAFNDGEWLQKEGYTNNDQEFIEEVDAIIKEILNRG
jgi:hypothetical protein